MKNFSIYKEKKKIKADKKINEKIFIILILLLGIIAAHSLLKEGHPIMGDIWPHLARTKLVYQILKEFKIPYWSFFLYCGYPDLQFYGPLYYYIAGIFTLIFGNLLFATKLLLFILHILSGIIMYKLIDRILKNKFAAFIGATSYLFTFWHLLHILYMGRYPVALIYLLTPLMFWRGMIFWQEKTFKNAILLGLTMTANVLIHPMYAFISIILLILMSIPYIKSMNKATLIKIFIVILVFITCSAFFTIPFLLEGNKYKNQAEDISLIGVSPLVLISWSKEPAKPHWHMGSYLGISILLLAFLGIIELIKKGEFFNSPIIFPFIFLLYFVFGSKLPLYDTLIRIHQLIPKRFLVFFIMFISILSAKGFLFLKNRFKKELELLIISVFLILLDLVPTTFQNTYLPPQAVLGGREKIYKLLEEGKTTVDIENPVNQIFTYGRTIRYPAMQFLYSNNPTPLGFYWQFAPKNSRYIYPWINLLACDLIDTTNKNISLNTQKILALLNIKYIITSPPIIYDEKGQPNIFLKEDLIWNLEGLQTNYFPVICGKNGRDIYLIASNTLKPWKRNKLVTVGNFFIAEDWQELLDSTNINFDEGTATCLWARGITEVKKLNDEKPLIKVLNYKVNHLIVEMELEVSSDCFVRLPWSYYPIIKVKTNDKSLELIESAEHLIIIKLNKGTHKIKIVPTLSKLRIITGIISFISFLIIIILLVNPKLLKDQ